MDPSFLPPVRKLEVAVNHKLKLQPAYNTCRVLNLNEFQEKESYECVVNIGNLTFISNPRQNRNAYADEIQAENVAAKHAYTEMLKRKWKLDPESQEKQQLIQSSVHKVSGVRTTREGWQSHLNMGKDQVDVIYKCGKYISDQVLAMLFKDIVRIIITDIIPVTTNNKEPVHRYTTRLRGDGVATGFISVLYFNGRNFESLGLMIDEYQAEQSAAEVCLRGLGFIPNVSRDKHLIQPYKGGIPRRIPGITIDRPYLFTSTIMSDALDAFLDARNMIRPMYYIRNAVSKLDPGDFTMNGEPEPIVECKCSIVGKVFTAPSPHIQRVAMQLAANEGLSYFSVDHPRVRMEIRKKLRINRFDFSTKGARTAENYRPSQYKGWIHPHFCGPVCYGDRDITSLLASDILLNNLPSKDYIHELVRREMESDPSFKGKVLRHFTELSVSEVDTNDPELFIIGNSQFSIKMLCTDGKIYSKQRSALVDVLPGHNIRKLKCAYRVSLPSLDIHLKAISCSDLYFDNPPLPVVTSCGAVVLFHDYQASPEDVFVLVRQRTSGTSFESKVHVLQGLLQSLITQKMEVVVTPAECTKDIEKWLYKEVVLLGDMTMESLCELMSTCTKYDTRWNELLAHSELASPLKEIQNICLKELKRRQDEGIPENQCELTWELPQSEFVTTFDTIGIHVEDSIFCVKRALAQSASILLRVHEIETCDTVDIPVEHDKKHRGGLCRYYLWNGLWDETKQQRGKIHESKEETERTKGYEQVINPKGEHGMIRYRYAFHERLYMNGAMFEQRHLMQNIEYVNRDGTRTKYTDTLKYRIDAKELKRNKYYSQQQKAEQNAESSTTNVTEDVAKSNVQPTPVVTKKDSRELTSVHLPGGAKFSSYKNTLQLYAFKNRIGVPCYSCDKEANLFRGAVTILNKKYVSRKLSTTPKLATARAAFDALQQFGYLKYMTFGQTHKKGEGDGPKAHGKRVDIAAKVQELKEKIKHMKDNNESNNVDSSINESINESSDAIDSSLNETVNESSDSIDPYSVIAGDEENNADNNPDPCVDPYSVTADARNNQGNNGVKVEVKEEVIEPETGDNSFIESDEHSEYKVVNEWTRDDESVSKTNGSRKRKRVSQWAIEDDITVDDLDMGFKEEKDKEFKRKRYLENQKKMRQDDGPPRIEEPTNQWAKHKDLKGFKKNMDKDSIKANAKRVTYATPEGRVTKYRKPGIPPLPARDAYREQVMWMRVDEAVDVCPMLKKISQTTQFKKALKKIVEDGNKLLETKGLTGSVKTLLLPDV